MAWYDKQYTPEYDRTRTALGTPGYAAGFAALRTELARALGNDGFEASGAQAFDSLRSLLGTARTGEPASANEATRLLDAAGASPGMTAAERQRAAALKMLRHVYLVKQRGGQSAWVVSLPLAMTDWPEDSLSIGTADAAKTMLASVNERFSADDRKNLSDGLQDALRWVQKAMVLLGELKGSGNAKANALAMVRRWFADAAASDAEVVTAADRLLQGFKSIAAALNGHRIVLTDFAPLRGAPAGSDEHGFLNSEAFVFALPGRERLNVIYVEQEFFGNNNVLTGKANWSRILVHELSHLVVGTDDIPAGADARYAWYGIGPNANFPLADAVRNAESWAFFAADCAGVLSDGQRSRALKVL